MFTTPILILITNVIWKVLIKKKLENSVDDCKDSTVNILSSQIASSAFINNYTENTILKTFK